MVAGLEGIQKGLGFGRVHILRQGRAHKKVAFGGFVAGDFDQILMVGGVAAHHGHVPAHFPLLPQQHARFRVVAGKENQVGFSRLEFGEDGRVVALSGGKSVVKDHLHAQLVQLSLGFLGQALGVGGIVVQQGHSLVAALDNGRGGGMSLSVVTRAGAEKKRQALFRQAHAGGARADLHQTRLVQNALTGFGHGRTVGADNRNHAGGGQLLRGQGGGARVARIVFHHQLDFAALDAAFGINLVGQQADDVFHVLAFGGPLARKRTHEPDLDVRRQRHGRQQQGQGQRPEPTATSFHVTPPSGMRVANRPPS